MRKDERGIENQSGRHTEDVRSGSRIDTDTTRVAYWPGLISKERRPHVLKMRINHEDTFVSLYLH